MNQKEIEKHLIEQQQIIKKQQDDIRDLTLILRDMTKALTPIVREFHTKRKEKQQEINQTLYR